MKDLEINVTGDEGEFEEDIVNSQDEGTVSLASIFNEEEPKDNSEEEPKEDSDKESETNSDEEPKEELKEEPKEDSSEDKTNPETKEEAIENLDDELEELEKLLSETEEESSKTDDEPSNELSEKLSKAVKEINKLRGQITNLQLDKAEFNKFGEDVGLSDEVIIIKAYYDKAKNGDEESKKKVLDLIKEDFGVDLVNPKEVYVNNSISSKPSVNTQDAESEYGINVM